MKFAAAQINCVPGDVVANCAEITAQARRAREQGCDAHVLPEMSDTGYTVEAIRASASAWDGAPFRAVSAAARECGLHIVCGLSEREGGRIYNSAAVFNPRGELVARYRKTHLFAVAPVSEDKVITAGDELVVVDIGGFRCGLMICYDLRFPELARALALKGADALVVCSAWQFPRLNHWITLIEARAIENQVYVVAANRIGTDGPTTFCGASRIVDPYGVTVAAAAEDRAQLITGDVNRETLDWARQRMPVMKHRRGELY
ncbi:MAG: carbon-nitrogen family hydrolase [Verrucomicrobia bacterium]|nr:carbon-nitrogen family hydrolase [Verrucomicrobiota bacterium]